MAILIEHIGQLRKEIMDYIDVAMDGLSKEMVDDLVRLVRRDFYDSYSPDRYDRTFNLLDSCKHPIITVTPNTVTLKVYVDFGRMAHYRYGGSSITEPTSKGKSFTEEELAMSASRGAHGIERGYVAAYTSRYFWEDFEKRWNISKVERTLKKYLRQLGLTVK